MANGERKAIADVEVGDQVLATDLSTGKTSARTVTDTMVKLHPDGDLLDLTIRDEDGEGVIQTTDGHPFWSVTDSDWQDAVDLSVGEELRQADGSIATVVKLTDRPGQQDMWDLTSHPTGHRSAWAEVGEPTGHRSAVGDGSPP